MTEFIKIMLVVITCFFAVISGFAAAEASEPICTFSLVVAILSGIWGTFI